MRRRLLGRTAIPASQISLGTVELGMDYGIAAAGESLRPEAKTYGAMTVAGTSKPLNREA